MEKIKKYITKQSVFYVMFLLFIIAFSSKASAYDYDLWARLIVGKYFIQTGHVLKQDFLSYTPTHLWYDHEWGSGVIFYLTQHLFSHVGLLGLQILIIFTIFFILTKIIELRGVKTTHPYNFLFYYFAFSSFGYVVNDLIRCQMFSFLLFTIFLYILELSRKGVDKPLWALPFLMIIWNNLHGGCVAGIGLVAMYLVGELFNKKPFKKYIYALLGTIVVLPINPWGFEYLKFLLEATTMKRPVILEWLSLFFKEYNEGFIEFKVFTSVLILFEVFAIVKQVIEKTFKLDFTKLLVIIVTVYLATQHIKMIPFAVISLTAFVYDDFYEIFNFITFGLVNKIGAYKDSVIYFIVLIYTFMNISPKMLQPFCDWNKFPIRVIEFIKINNLKGNLFIAYGAGSFAGYKLYPNNKVFMDGRYEEVYYDYTLDTMLRFSMVRGKNWQDVLTFYPTDLLAIEKPYPVYKTMLKNPNWVDVFEDNTTALFVKRKDLKKQYKYPSVFLKDYKDTLFDTDIDFRKIHEN